MLRQNTPWYDSESRVINLPEVEGIQWLVNDSEVQPGTVGPLEEGQTARVKAQATSDDVYISGTSEWVFGG